MKEYEIRLEARKYSNLIGVQYYNAIGAIIEKDDVLNGWVGIINRNTVINEYVAPVPEPTTILLLGLGVLGLAGVIRKKNSIKQ